MLKKVKKIKVFCTDADGVLNDLEHFQKWMVEDYYKQLGKPVPRIINPHGYDIAKRYEIGKIRRNVIWIKNFKRYCQEFPARPDTFETLRWMQSEGIKVPIVTARAFVMHPIFGPIAREWFEEWLELNDFEADGIDYCQERGSGPVKAAACLKRKADLMADDKIDNFDCILDVCDTVGFPTAWNEGYEPKGKENDFYWVPNYWPDVKKLIMRRNG